MIKQSKRILLVGAPAAVHDWTDCRGTGWSKTKGNMRRSFVDHDAALRFVRAADGYRPRAVVMVSEALELDMSRTRRARSSRMTGDPRHQRRIVLSNAMSPSARTSPNCRGTPLHCRHRSMLEVISTTPPARLCEVRIAHGATPLVAAGHDPAKPPTLRPASIAISFAWRLVLARPLPVIAGAGADATARADGIDPEVRSDLKPRYEFVRSVLLRRCQPPQRTRRVGAIANGCRITGHSLRRTITNCIQPCQRSRIVRLADLLSMIGPREPRAAIRRGRRGCASCRNGFPVASGRRGSPWPIWHRHDGCVSVTSNVRTGLSGDMFLSWNQGHSSEPSVSRSRLPTDRSAFSGEQSRPVQPALALFRLMLTECSLPLVGFRDEGRAGVSSVLAAHIPMNIPVA